MDGLQAFERWELLNLEPPVHTRLRRLVLEAFTPRAVEAQRLGIEARAHGLLAQGREQGRLDLVASYAQDFSLGIICDLIGVSPEDRDTIKRLSDDTVSMYEVDPQRRAAGQGEQGRGGLPPLPGGRGPSIAGSIRRMT